MKPNILILIVGVLVLFLMCTPALAAPMTEPIIANHTTTHLYTIPKTAIEQAKTTLHIAYGHTSHGSQITEGMTGLAGFTNATYGGSFYRWNKGGTGGALDLHDYAFDQYGASDLGNPNTIAWDKATRNYLNSHPKVNVIMWSWCGQVSGISAADLQNNYLNRMNQLETDYPDVKFVYMTGHLDGSGTGGNLNQRNEQIRNYCREHNKILFDFADIESYDPDAIIYYVPFNADDGCNYKIGVTTHNWAIDWQNAHIKNVDWYDCGAAHTQPLNANRKAYAAWWLWARLGGWNPVSPPVAHFTVDTKNGHVPLTVQFTDLSTGAISSHAWDFENDGVIDTTEKDPVYTYTKPGVYSANLTVFGPGGIDSEVMPDIIVITLPIISLPGFSNPPTDPDHDGIYEDLNGNGRLDFADVVLYFNQMEWIAGNEPVSVFDLNGDGRIDFADIVNLFGEI